MGLYSGVMTTTRAPRSIHSSFQWASGILFSTKFLPQLVFSLEKRMSERSQSDPWTPNIQGCDGF